ncbi:sugar ABC transporter ATP-binding protein [Candidatus Latescibacterota bacterium]
MESSNILEMKGIVKAFPGVVALDHVDFELRHGEVHVLLGENGAGKSTLVKILSGAYLCDEGAVILNGRPVEIKSPRDAQKQGIGTVYQELNLIPTMDAARNIFLGHLPQQTLVKKLKRINWNKIYNESRELLGKFDVSFDMRSPVSRLSIAQRQIIEIVKALVLQSDIIILDEPTSTLTGDETEKLFAIINQLKNNGVSFIYISHRLEEITRIGDRITVLRDGRFIETVGRENAPKSYLVKLMVGREYEEQYPKEHVEIGGEVLRVEGLSRSEAVRDINFTVRKGEIVGIAGLIGAGRTEMVRTLFGADRKTSGEIYIDNVKADIRSPEDAIGHGLGLITEDRKSQGLVLNMTVRQNIALASAGKTCRCGIIDHKTRTENALRYIKELQIKTPDIDKCVKYLSGGNQQKVILAKWICTNSKVLIFDEPTRGIDVGAKVEIYKLMMSLAQKGVGIIMISSDLEEILELSDSIIVMFGGRITGELSRDQATKETIMHYATGHAEEVFLTT